MYIPLSVDDVLPDVYGLPIQVQIAVTGAPSEQPLFSPKSHQRINSISQIHTQLKGAKELYLVLIRIRAENKLYVRKQLS
jgi:hypothetical protein